MATNVDKEIEKLNAVDLELKTDIDDILDVINELNDVICNNKDIEMVKVAKEMLPRYKIILKQYSDLMLLNDSSRELAETLKGKGNYET